MNVDTYVDKITKVLKDAVELSRKDSSGKVADYIPELKNVDESYVAASVMLADGDEITVGDTPEYMFTLQSVSKLVLLIGLLEEFGASKVFSWINVEPSGQPFASIGHLERFGPVPSNPLINAGAISLCGRIPGTKIEQLEWVKKWVFKLFGDDLPFSESVFKSEFTSSERNRSLAYLMKSTGILKREVEEVLIPYFSLCSYKININQAAFLPLLLANGGITPDKRRIISEETSNQVVSIMATCGLYDESGIHLLRTGLPAKSGVSGLIVAVATGRGGIAVHSPKLNNKGGSVRGHIILSELSKQLGWHFASPWGYTRYDSTLHKAEDNAVF